MTYKDLARTGARTLHDSGVENAAQEAAFMLRSLLDCSASDYLLLREQTADEEITTQYSMRLQRRTKGEPLQYILGKAEFLGNPFAVGEGVLIPRPETEELAEICIKRIREKGYRNVFDLCAGSGCIGISIAVHCPQTQVWMFEKYEAALRYLNANIPPAAAERIHVIKTDILDSAPQALPAPDLIVSNPPYIISSEIGSLQAEVQREPHTALDGGADGFLFYRAIAVLWAPLITPGGLLALECGEHQSAEIMNMLPEAAKKEILQDMFGVDRFVTAAY